MALTYLFFQPARLPLAADELDSTTVLSLADGPQLRATVEQAFPGLRWQSQHAAGATVDGNWYEVRLPMGLQDTLAVRCSLRADHSTFVQHLCDQCGWLAFDEQSTCFQPNSAPIAA